VWKRPLHAFEEHQVPPGIGDRDGDGDPGLLRASDGGGHHLFRPAAVRALGIGDRTFFVLLFKLY